MLRKLELIDNTDLEIHKIKVEKKGITYVLSTLPFSNFSTCHDVRSLVLLSWKLACGKFSGSIGLISS
jgi:hypothetical protein